MFKRAIWMGTGYGLGMGTSWWVKRKVRREMGDRLDRYVSPELRTKVGDRARDMQDSLAPRLEQVKPHLDQGRERVAPHVARGLSAGREAVGPRVEAGRERVQAYRKLRSGDPDGVVIEPRTPVGELDLPALDVDDPPNESTARRWLRVMPGGRS